LLKLIGTLIDDWWHEPASGSSGICSLNPKLARLDLDVRSAPRDAPPEAMGKEWDMAIITVLIGVLIIVVVGAICFWAIDKFASDGRLANLLKLLVVLVCLGAIVQRLLVLTY
jgi:hypothetical protein